MKLNLENDLIVFDVETTGLSIVKDRIVQIALLKIYADGRPQAERCRIINPTIPIPKEASDVHKITDEMVKNEPTFSKIAKSLLEFIGKSDFLTYNGNRFDIPLLMEEFERAGMQLDMSERKTLDAQRIFHKMEPRTLSAAVKFYTGEKFENAHDAGNDVRATFNVFKSQIERYKERDYEDEKGTIIKTPVINNMQSIHEFVNDPSEVDFQGKITMKNGEATFTFGKYQGQSVGKSLSGDYKYMNWILSGDFSADTKKHVRRLVEEHKQLVK